MADELSRYMIEKYTVDIATTDFPLSYTRQATKNVDNDFHRDSLASAWRNAWNELMTFKDIKEAAISYIDFLNTSVPDHCTNQQEIGTK